MKDQILQFFRSDRTFANAVKLYMGIPTAKMSFKKQLNMQPENPQLKETLFQELREIAGLSFKEYKVLMLNPVKVAAKLKQKVAAAQDVAHEAKAREFTVEKKIQQIPVTVRKAIRLRDEFPFLKDKECPPIFKILVADMLTAYEKYVKAHADLFTADNEEAILQAAKDTVENYLENHAIWDELNYYREHKEFLGKHPEFARNDKYEGLMKMTVVELVERRESLKKQITNYQGKIKKGDKPAKKKEWSDKITDFKEELSEIKRILGKDE